MIFTIYKSCTDTESIPNEHPWNTWIDTLSIHIIRPEKDGPCFIPGTVTGPRKAANVAAMAAVVLDVEKISPDRMARVLVDLDAYEYVFYTTHSHTPEKPRGRIVLPFDTPVPPDVFRAVWGRITAYLGGIHDPVCKDFSRLYYLPSAPPGTTPETHHNTGKYITADSFDGYVTPEIIDPGELPPGDPVSSTVVARVIKALAKTSDPDRAETWAAVLDGRSIAPRGHRHNALLSLTYDLAGELVNKAPADIAPTFAASLDAMGDGAPSMAAVIEMLTSARAKHHTIAQSSKSTVETAHRTKVLAARGDGIDTPYTDGELSEIATAQGCHPEALRQRWIIYIDGAMYFLTHGGYVGPYAKEGPALADVYLSPAGIQAIEYLGQAQRPRLKPMGEILRVHGLPARKVIADLTIQASKYDAHTQIFREATAARSPVLEPTDHPDIDEWMRALGGDHADRLLDWVAIAPQLKLTACGLYLYGHSGTGKTLIAHGLSKLWGSGTPTDIKNVLGDFNASIAKNPLILADEYIPQKAGESVTAQLRQLIGAQQLLIRRKFLPDADVYGNVRLIFTSNEEQLFQFDDSIGKQGQEALAKRIMYIPTDKRSAGLLSKVPDDRLQTWLRTGIAEHALWLASTREITPGDRLHIEGDMGPMVRKLNIAGRATSLVCEWLVGYILNPTLISNTGRGLVRVIAGELLVNNAAVVRFWDSYHRHERQLSTQRISKALGALSCDYTPRNIRVEMPGRGKTRLRFWAIDIENIIAWAEDNNFSARDEIVTNLETMTENEN